MSDKQVIKIIHFADLHIGVENYSKFASEAYILGLPDYFSPHDDRVKTYIGLPTRLIDTLVGFDGLIKDAIDLKVDLVVFAGDAFRLRDPSQTQQREFAKRILRLTNAGIKVFLLAGNHDIPNAQGRATSLEIYDTLNVEGVTVASGVGNHALETNTGTIQISALPWLRRSAVVTREGSERKSHEEIRKYSQDVLSQSIGKMASELEPTQPALLVGHATVSTARLGSEQSMMMGNDYLLLPGVVGDKRFDYVALGHIHRHQILQDRPPTVYSGSLHRVDFSEENDEKGYCLVTIEMGDDPSHRKTQVEFKQVWARKFKTISVKLDSDDYDPTSSTIEMISKERFDDAIVRINIEGTPTDIERLDVGQIFVALKEAFYIAGINFHELRNESSRTRLENKELPVDISPLKALELYMDDRKISGENRKRLVVYAKALIEKLSAGSDS